MKYPFDLHLMLMRVNVAGSCQCASTIHLIAMVKSTRDGRNVLKPFKDGRTQPKLPRRAVSRRRTSSAVLIVIVATLFVVAGGSIATAVLLHGSSRAPSTAPIAHSTASANQDNAPNISTPGGAIEGAGSFNALTCPTSQECVAVGGGDGLAGVAATSTDDGSSWSLGNFNSNEPELNAIDCTSANDCVAVGEGAIVTSIDGGQTWVSKPLPSANTTLLGVSCSSPTTCVSVGVSPGDSGPLPGEVLLSSTGGSSWIEPTLPRDVGALGSVDCPSPSFCVAVGAQILTSDNGGKTWTQRFVNGGTGVLRSVSCSSDSSCVAIGVNPLGESSPNTGSFEIVTTDGGITWAAANGISASSATLSWTSNDGGKSWASATPPTGVTALSSVACRADSNCVFVGLQGTSPVSGSSLQGAPWSISSLTPELFSAAAQ